MMVKQIHLQRRGSPSGGSSRPDSRRSSGIWTLDASSLCAPDTKEINTSKRLQALREVMAENGVAVYIVPSEDQHHSEYVSAADQRRAFISGFQGSAGVAIITRDVTSMNEIPDGLAALSTDARYFNQATNELDFNWLLLKQGAPGQPSWEEWTVDQAMQLARDSGDKINIGVDPKLISISLYEKFKSVIASKKKSGVFVELVPVNENLVDKIWNSFEDPSPKPCDIIKSLDDKYTGQSIEEKIDAVLDLLKTTCKANGLIVSSLDDIAWLLNLRGSDIDYNPVFYSHLIISDDRKITLFADNDRFDTKVQDAMAANNITVLPYTNFWLSLVPISKEFYMSNRKLLISKNTSWEVIRQLKCPFDQINTSPIADLKAIKNPVELEGAKRAHLKDGRAIIKFLSWLENELVINNELVDEIEADNVLTSYRKVEESFQGLLFATISATGANAAVVHYKPEKGLCSVIDPSKIYLVDTGAQFLDGTTDTTRTVHFTEPTQEQKDNYTLVLKGNLALGDLKFPEETYGFFIDSIARQFLWSKALDYGHGTGHGVGAFLNVHEGPIGISPRSNFNVLKEGNLISNEPGYYEDGAYGIRIENVMFVKSTGSEYNGKKFFEFETVTRVPYCHKLINRLLLTAHEIQLINNYHKVIWEEISPSFTKGSLEYNWLKRETSSIV